MDRFTSRSARRIAPVALALVAAVVVVATGHGNALAHERREVVEHSFVVGFVNEPAYEGEPNGVDLRVEEPRAAGSSSAKGAEGLEQTLRVEVTHVATGMSETYDLTTVFGQPGRYRANLIPTASGQYRFRFFGTVAGKDVNETFESGPGRFSDIETRQSVQFPVKVASDRELEGAVRTAGNDADSAAGRANLALALGIAGLVIGLAALGMSLRPRRGA